MFTITVTHVLDCAAGLRSEHGENPEYDRALVEMSMQLLGISEDEPGRDTVKRLIGVRP